MELGIYSVNENSGYGYEFFTYDGFNRLIKYGDEKNNTASYEYLSNGLRLSKTVNGKKTSFIWDGNNIQFTVSSDETVSYSRAPGYMRARSTKDMADGVAAKNRESILYLYNGHGDVTGTTNKDGNIKKTYDYDAFGNEISPDSSDTNPFRYCGEYYDSETKNIYLRARYYNMSTGRFISEDPIKDGVNWYAYCGGNPVTYVDTSGYYEVTAKNVKEGVSALLLIGYENARKVLKLSDLCSYEASLKAEEWGLSVTWDNKADAYRHFIWNYKSTEEIGFINTCVFMDAHEDKEQIYVGKNSDGVDCYLTPIASLMDINNNMYGRNMAQFGDYGNADEAFETALNNGNLLLSLSETKEFYNIPNTWIYGAGDERYGNIYESVIIEGKISDIGGIPGNVKLVNPSDVKK